MALKLIRSGPVTRQGVVSPGSGWVNVTGADPNNSSNPYWFGYSGYCLMTVTAWNVAGLRVIEWGKDRFLESGLPGTAHSVSGVLDLSQRSAVVRVLNPTDKAEIVINWIPLSLSLFVEFAAAWLRRWHHGSKKNHPHPRDRQWCGLVCQKDGQRGGATHRRARNPRVFPRTVRAHIADVRTRVRPIHHQCLHTPSRHQQQGVSHPARLLGQRVGSHHLHRLATVGGGA